MTLLALNVDNFITFKLNFINYILQQMLNLIAGINTYSISYALKMHIQKIYKNMNSHPNNI
ncbi:hypothetical protein SADUNF_Sadunf17G0105700 [Salix dunnii]|uniref:Uncharacterized protein n=1 Tax=Salix dunnii TaxID=1413687 RepID=A0A835MNM0_9ROSI|nr:hypothetical protein SADUNF_Sadunf17G0105700 [Salix dunnii]